MGAITREMRAADKRGPAHCAGSIGYRTLAVLEDLLGPNVGRTAETGCGRSTILFSRLSAEHHVFCIDDREVDRSSVRYYTDSSVSEIANVRMTFGPTQETLFRFEHPGAYDAVLLDGPHGYPFPELEYFHFYPRIRSGGLLIIDDVQIATVGRMADVLQEDAMWDMEVLSGKTVFFRRTSVEPLPPDGDDWYRQNFNLRRTDRRHLLLVDGGRMPSFEERLTAQASVSGRLRRVVDRLTGRGSRASRHAP